MVRSLPFREQFRETPYPFSDNAVLETTTGYSLPKTLFLDASLCIRSVPLKLMLIQKRQQFVVFWFGTGSDLRQASCTIPLIDTDGDKRAVIYAKDNLSCGFLVYDAAELLSVITWPSGDHVINRKGAELCLRCYVSFRETGLSGFRLEDGRIQRRNLCLVGGSGVILEQGDKPDERNIVTVHVTGDPLYQRVQLGNQFVTPRFLETLKIESGKREDVIPDTAVISCPPDADGRVKLEHYGGNPANPTDVLRIGSSESTLTLEFAGA